MVTTLSSNLILLSLNNLLIIGDIITWVKLFDNLFRFNEIINENAIGNILNLFRIPM